MGCTTSTSLMQHTNDGKLGDAVSADNHQLSSPNGTMKPQNGNSNHDQSSILSTNDDEIMNSSFSSSLSISSPPSPHSSIKSSLVQDKLLATENDMVDPANPLTSMDNIQSSSIQFFKADIETKENKSTKEMAEEIDIDLNDPEVGKAAVKIQAGFKNFMAIKNKNKTNDDNNKTVMTSGRQDQQNEENKQSKTIEQTLADINLNDPEMEKAAQKIQASFRGYKNRQKDENEQTATIMKRTT